MHIKKSCFIALNLFKISVTFQCHPRASENVTPNKQAVIIIFFLFGKPCFVFLSSSMYTENHKTYFGC